MSHNDLSNKLYRKKEVPMFFFVCQGHKGDSDSMMKLKEVKEGEWEPLYVPVSHLQKGKHWSKGKWKGGK